jgi:hypothetical protein
MGVRFIFNIALLVEQYVSLYSRLLWQLREQQKVANHRIKITYLLPRQRLIQSIVGSFR